MDEIKKPRQMLALNMHLNFSECWLIWSVRVVKAAGVNIAAFRPYEPL